MRSNNYYDFAEIECPGCRVRNVEVRECRDEERPCRYCGYNEWTLARCCIPDCERVLPVTSSFPVCRPCGIRISVVFWNDSEMRAAVEGERNRQTAAIRSARKNGRVPQSRVYYVRLDEQRIKIGFSINLQARLRALRVPDSALLAVEPGGRDLETRRHHQFQGERIHRNREDFRPTDRLLTWIDSIRYTHGLPDWAQEPDTGTVTVRSAS